MGLAFRLTDYRVGHNHSVRAAVGGLTPWNRICPSGLSCLLRPPFGYAACGATRVVLCRGLKPAVECIGSGDFGERLRPRTANLQLVPACAGSGGSWKRACCKPRPAATSIMPGVAQQKAQGIPRLASAYHLTVRILTVKEPCAVYEWSEAGS